MTKPIPLAALAPPSYPRSREHALSLLRLSAHWLDADNIEKAVEAHGHARAYMQDHPSEFPEYHIL